MLARASGVLRAGGVVALPTDTVYGLAALATRADAVTRLYEIKGRVQTKPIAICVAQIDHIYRCCGLYLSARVRLLFAYIYCVEF